MDPNAARRVCTRCGAWNWLQASQCHWCRMPMRADAPLVNAPYQHSAQSPAPWPNASQPPAATGTSPYLSDRELHYLGGRLRGTGNGLLALSLVTVGLGAIVAVAGWMMRGESGTGFTWNAVLQTFGIGAILLAYPMALVGWGLRRREEWARSWGLALGIMMFLVGILLPLTLCGCPFVVFLFPGLWLLTTLGNSRIASASRHRRAQSRQR